ncbi:alpha/beta hydrolase [Thermaurantiacus sp.]
MTRGPHPLGPFLTLLARESQGDEGMLRRALLGLRRYQGAQGPCRPGSPAVARSGGVVLRHVAGPAAGRPAVLVPSLINGPEILDLAPGRSLATFLGNQGLRVLLLDWGPMTGGERRLGLAGLVSRRLVPLLAALGAPAAVVGYCLGGTLGIGLAAIRPDLVRHLALIATPWRFDGYPAADRARAGEVWQAIAPLVRRLGAAPLSLLNPLFWALDPGAVAAKFARLAEITAQDPAFAEFVAVEDWAGSGVPVPAPVVRDLFEHGFRTDRFGRGRWRVAGRRVVAEGLSLPVLEAGATRDRIVPAAARPVIPGARRIEVAAGHVGMIVGRARHALWEPLGKALAAD